MKLTLNEILEILAYEPRPSKTCLKPNARDVIDLDNMNVVCSGDDKEIWAWLRVEHPSMFSNKITAQL